MGTENNEIRSSENVGEVVKEKDIKKNLNEKEEIKVVEPKPIVAKPKFVKVKSKINGRRFIGGTWYSLERDREIEVTEDAKRSLTRAGAIYL